MAGQKILLVEGTDDEHVLKHICGNRGIPHLDQVRPHDGDTDLLDDLSVQLRASSDEGDIVGVVIDADKNPSGRWQSIRDKLLESGYQDVPGQPDPKGTVIDPPNGSLLPRVGIWIMPNNEAPGKLEDFLISIVPQQDKLFTHATEVVESLPVQRFNDKDKPKAVIHTWLAWQSSPGRPYGTAITAGFLSAHAPRADVLVAWLNRLFYL